MAVLAVFLLLAVGEISLRAYHQRTMRARLPVELRPETRAIIWDDIKDHCRIVCFGDSITFGEGLPYEQSYPAVLESLLKQKDANLNVTVINAGIGGHTSVLGLARLERDVLWYRPHAVIVAFGINDANLGYWLLDPVRERRMCGDLLLWERVDTWLRHSHLYLTLRGRFRRLLRSMGWEAHPATVGTVGEPSPAAAGWSTSPRVSRQGFEIAQERLVQRIRREVGIVPILATMTPVSEDFRAERGPAEQGRQRTIYQEYDSVIRKVAADCAATLLDLRAIFTQGAGGDPRCCGMEYLLSLEPAILDRSSALLAEDGVHLTAAGQRLIAIHAQQALEEAGLVPSRQADGESRCCGMEYQTSHPAVRAVLPSPGQGQAGLPKKKCIRR